MAKLKMDGPPGRANRKARAFTADIVEAAEAGYTLAAIREALRGEGIEVSRSTVHRELRRGRKAAAETPAQPGGRVVEAVVAVPADNDTVSHLAPPNDGTTVRTQSRPVERRDTSMQQAEEFAKSHISNPLLKKRERK